MIRSMSYSRYLRIAIPTAAGISGKTISNTGSGLLLNWLTVKMITAAMAEAYMNHLSCSRCSCPERRNRTIIDTAPTRNTASPTLAAWFQTVLSGATTVTGSRNLGKLFEKLTLEIAEDNESTRPAKIAAQITGRHRGEGGRPSGNSSGIRNSSGDSIPRATVRVQPAHDAPGSSSPGARRA